MREPECHEIRRRPDGSIDFGFYQRRARPLREAATRKAFLGVGAACGAIVSGVISLAAGLAASRPHGAPRQAR